MATRKTKQGRQLDFLAAEPRGIEPGEPGRRRSSLPLQEPGLDQATVDGLRWLRRVHEAALRPGCDSWPRAILHADLDCFFVSVERLLDPSLVGKPVVVGGSPQSRGVVCSASYEARAFGVRSAMPSSQAARLCPQAVFVRPRGPYREFSRSVRAIFERFTPLVQMVSLDEGYLDITATLAGRAPVQVAEEIRATVRRETGLPISLGAATSRLVAKVASGQAKPDGVLAVFPGREAAFLGPLPLKVVPGLGGKTREQLEAFGIKTVGELRDQGRRRLRTIFGPEHGSRLFYRLCGFDDSPVLPGGTAKSTSRERTFGEDVARMEELEAMASDLALRVAADLRKINARASTLTLKMRRPDFQTITRACPLDPPSCDDAELVRAARDLLHRHHQRGDPLRLMGVCASGLRFETWQPDLLAEHGLAQRLQNTLALNAAMDEIRRRHGFQSLRPGSSIAPSPHTRVRRNRTARPKNQNR